MFKKLWCRGAWMASDFSSCHNFLVHEFEPRIRLSAVSMEPASDALSLSFCPSSAHSLSFFFSN